MATDNPTTATPGGDPRHTPAPSRRGLLAGGIALLPIAAAAAVLPLQGESPDAELLALAVEVRDCDAWLQALNDAPNDIDDEDEVTEANRALAAAVAAMCEQQATTPAGVRAKAEASRLVLRRYVRISADADFEDLAEAHELLALSLAEDVLGLVGGAS